MEISIIKDDGIMKALRIPNPAIICLTIFAFIVPIGLSAKFSFEQEKVNISVIPDYTHFPIKIKVSTQIGKECLSRIKLESDASWVKPSLDAETAELILTLDTLNLFNKSYTATIPGDLDGSKSQVEVEATIAGLNIIQMAADPFRPRVYALSSNKETLDSVVVYDPFEGKPLARISHRIQ